MLISVTNEIPPAGNPADIPLVSEGLAPEARLAALSTEHDDLDAAIAALLNDGSCDGLLITRLKKRKLQLKDEIAFVMLARRYSPMAQAS